MTAVVFNMASSSISHHGCPPFTLGWDMGGAHLKIAVLDSKGRLIAVEQYPCALWRGLDQLTLLLNPILKKWAPISQHALTMSGEMVDLFSDRVSGVRTLIETFAQFVGETPLQIYSAHLGFISLNESKGNETYIASANWLASAAWAAQYLDHGILLDIGSTTTDVLCFEQGCPTPVSIGDADRLVSGELVYTGVTRTPLMALAQHIVWKGLSRGVMAELFATTADVYRVLRTLPDHADQHDTADGGPKTPAASITRIARMIGMDGNEYEEAEWVQLAEVWQSLQQKQIRVALDRAKDRLLASSVAKLRAPIPIVVAGVGGFLGLSILNADDAQTEFTPMHFSALGNLIDPDLPDPMLIDYATRCAPAVAVAALLLHRNFNHRSISA